MSRAAKWLQASPRIGAAAELPHFVKLTDFCPVSGYATNRPERMSLLGSIAD